MKVLKIFNYLTVALTITVSPVCLSSELPQYDGRMHLGVVSCASSVCHGSTIPQSGTRIPQNEYVTWSLHDRHRRAYETLLSDDSERLARNLGLTSAHEEEVCLNCHADNIPQDLRGKRFRIEDGVGCEACHGGAQNYIAEHSIANSSMKDKVTKGLYQTDLPDLRGKLCLSCHLGTTRKFASHDIMGAGHPRLSFELDTFTYLQPAHFEIDEDYTRVKWSGTGVQLWIAGQIQTAGMTLELIAYHLESTVGFPELSIYNCHACHRPMSDRNWKSSSRPGMRPGEVPLNTASFLFLEVLTDVFAPEMNKRISEQISRLQQYAAGKRKDSPVKEIELSLKELERRIHREDPSNRSNDILEKIVELASSGEIIDYGHAEQILMSIDALLSASDSRESRHKELILLYNLLENEDRFKPAEFSDISKKILPLPQ